MGHESMVQFSLSQPQHQNASSTHHHNNNNNALNNGHTSAGPGASDNVQVQVGRQGRKQMRRMSLISKQERAMGPPATLTRAVSRMGQQSMRHVANSALSARRVYHQDRTRMQRNATMRQQHVMKRLEQMSQNGDMSDPRHSQQLTKMKTFVRKQIESRESHGHKPVFAIGVTLVQFAILIAMLVTSEFASWGMGVQNLHRTVQLLEGNTTQSLTRAQNPYFGPQVESLVSWGSKWGACMREDKIATSVRLSSSVNDTFMGCCVSSSGRCGFMSHPRCNYYDNSNWIPPQNDTKINVCNPEYSNCSTVFLRPCCFGIYGQCAVISEQHCTAISGKWQPNSFKCGEVDCLREACGMEHYLQGTFKLAYPIQIYRFVTAIFLHVGVIHFVMNALGQYVLVAQVEFVAGPFRTGVMYILSGMCGFMISALFSSTSLSNGSSAAIYGMLGVGTVDLFQTWQLLEDKASQVFGLVFKLAIFLGIGTLPYIDNFAHVGGFIGGVVVGLWLLPYIVFDRADGCRKHMLRVVSAVGLLVLIGGLLAKFFTDDSIVCDYCKYIDCIPFTPKMCSSSG